ncbi:MAG: sugar nucleotide-binding protein, partial [Pirellula sp.]
NQIPYVVFGRGESTNAVSLRKAIETSGADHLINCAGYTGKPNVDACEIHQMECLEGNGVLPGIVRHGCEMAGIPWGHVSSGCIYTGRRADGSGFTEQDPPNFSFRQNNCSFYSGCKALGEELLAGAENCYVWRLRIPFENTANPRNYLQKVINYSKLLDAENSLSNLNEFVTACVDSFRLRIPFGIYNLTNPGSVTTRQVVEMIHRKGVSSKVFEFFKDEAEFMKQAAKTPRSNCVLDSSKAISVGLRLRPVEESLDDSLEHWQIV